LVKVKTIYRDGAGVVTAQERLDEKLRNELGISFVMSMQWRLHWRELLGGLQTLR